MVDPLERFVVAQDSGKEGSSYHTALSELQTYNEKKSCWIWYVFPQLLARSSEMCRKYQIYGRKEAVLYLCHPTLSSRYKKICSVVLQKLSDDEKQDSSTELALTNKSSAAKNNGPHTLLTLFGWDVDALKAYQSISTFFLACCDPTVSTIPFLEKWREFLWQVLTAIARSGYSHSLKERPGVSLPCSDELPTVANTVSSLALKAYPLLELTMWELWHKLAPITDANEIQRLQQSVIHADAGLDVAQQIHEMPAVSMFSEASRRQIIQQLNQELGMTKSGCSARQQLLEALEKDQTDEIHRLLELTTTNDGLLQQLVKDPAILYEAVASGSLSGVADLLDHGADVNAPYEGWPPLLIATRLAFSEIVWLLVQAEGIDLTVSTVNDEVLNGHFIPKGRNILHTAVGTHAIKVIRMLLGENEPAAASAFPFDIELGAVPKEVLLNLLKQKDADGCTPLELACFLPGLASVIPILASAAGVTAPDPLPTPDDQRKFLHSMRERLLAAVHRVNV